MRGKDKAPRRRRTQAEMEMAEFLPTRRTMVETVPERRDEPKTEDPESVQAFAASVLNDPAYRQSVRDRAKTGRLLPVEARMLVEFGKLAPEKKVQSAEPWTTYATSEEVQTVARIMRYIIGRRDGKQHPNDPARRYERRNINGDPLVDWR